MVVFLGVQPFLLAQDSSDFSPAAAASILHALADDSMKGRGNGRPELLKAGLYIGNRFEKAGLQPLPGFISYYIPFRPFGGSKKIVPDRLFWNGKELETNQYRLLNPVPGAYHSKSLKEFRVIKLD